MSDIDLKSELRRLLAEREKLKQEERRIDDQLALLAGCLPSGKIRKDKRRTFTAEEFSRACGV